MYTCNALLLNGLLALASPGGGIAYPISLAPTPPTYPVGGIGIGTAAALAFVPPPRPLAAFSLPPRLLAALALFFFGPISAPAPSRSTSAANVAKSNSASATSRSFAVDFFPRLVVVVFPRFVFPLALVVGSYAVATTRTQSDATIKSVGIHGAYPLYDFTVYEPINHHPCRPHWI
jgi:hypothetical protein